MTLVPTDSAVGVVAKFAAHSPEAAEQLARIALFESFADQLEELRPHMELQVHKNLAATTATARAALLRSHVGKALDGQPEPDDTAYAEALAVLDEYVEKSLSGWLLSAFNNRVTRDEHGRFARNPSHPIAQPPPYYQDAGHGRQQSAVDLASLTFGATQGQANRLTQDIFDDSGKVKHGDNAAADWYAPTEGTDRRAYRRLKMTGDALANRGVPGSPANFVGNLTALAGEMGPEAEKVLGPGIRRTAYRYRGTERRPDGGLVANVDQAHGYITGFNGTPDEQAAAQSQLEQTNIRDKGSNPAVTITNRWKDAPRLTPDQKELLIQGDAAVASMLGVGGRGRAESVLPDLDLVRLSLESGEMPPSHGVIIDADGKVATQAIGYNGDHYLPFDLRNLGALQGGQYVRSRATGGLTTEDIYTGLLTGARQIQVISNSGVFTVEFDPDFRGARRYNDKAHRMIERYGSMLEAIQHKTIYEPGADLPAETKSRMRTEAMAARPKNRKEFDEYYQQLEEQERLKASISEVDMAELEEAATSYGQTAARQEAIAAREARREMSPTQLRQVAAEAAGRYRRENQPVVRQMKLDGVGYDNAMRALQQEFPYYIRRAQWQPLDAWLAQYDFPNAGDDRFRRHAPEDVGYTKPGQTNVPKARKGGFRTARYVPEKTRGAGTATSTDPENPTPPAAEAQQGQQNGQQNGQRNGTGNGLGRAGQPINVAEQTKATGKLAKEAALPVTALSSAVTVMPWDFPGGDRQYTDDEVISTLGDASYLRWKLMNLRVKVGSANLGREFYAWLANEATPTQVDSIRDGIALSTAELQNNGDDPGYAGVPKAPQFEAAAKKLFELYDIAHPFAEVPAGTAPESVTPQEQGQHAKPPKMPGVPEVGAPIEEFDRARGHIELGNDQVKGFLAAADADGPEGLEAVVNLAADEYTNEEHDNGEVSPQALKKLQDAQTAWSFAQARALTVRLRDIVGDAAPLEVVSARYQPRRRLLFG